MKKQFTVVSVAAAMALAAGITANAEIYPKSGIVTDVNETKNSVTVMDLNGNEWSFSGSEDWIPGDNVAMIMDDQGTTIIYDDEIVSVRYEGNRRGFEIIEGICTDAEGNGIDEGGWYIHYPDWIRPGKAVLTILLNGGMNYDDIVKRHDVVLN